MAASVRPPTNSGGACVGTGVAKGAPAVDLFGYDPARFHQDTIADARWVQARKPFDSPVYRAWRHRPIRAPGASWGSGRSRTPHNAA